VLRILEAPGAIAQLGERLLCKSRQGLFLLPTVAQSP